MEENQLALFEQGKIYVAQTRKWLKFLAVVGAISLILMVFLSIVFLLGGSSLATALQNGVPLGRWYGLVYLASAIIGIFPLLYIFRSAAAAKTALECNDSAQMTEYIKNVKKYWKFTAIVSIVALALCLIGGIVAAIAAVAAF